MSSDIQLYSQMQDGKPYRAFKKTIPSRLSCISLNPFDETQPENIILRGDAQRKELSAYVPLWTERAYLFFKRANRIHIEAGRLVEAEYPSAMDVQPSPNMVTDEEIDELVMSKHLALKNRVEKVTSEATLHRFLKRAEELERPEKTLIYLRERLSLIQGGTPEGVVVVRE